MLRACIFQMTIVQLRSDTAMNNGDKVITCQGGREPPSQWKRKEMLLAEAAMGRLSISSKPRAFLNYETNTPIVEMHPHARHSALK